MMRSDHTCVCLGLSIAVVCHCRRKGPVPSCPIVVGNDIVIVVESALRLLVDYSENLVDCIDPYKPKV